jgi:hypothetical protein
MINMVFAYSLAQSMYIMLGLGSSNTYECLLLSRLHRCCLLLPVVQLHLLFAISRDYFQTD